MQIIFEYILLAVAAIFTVIYILDTVLRHNSFSLERALGSYLFGLGFAAGIGVIFLTLKAAGLELPVKIYIDEVKIYLPLVGIALIYISLRSFLKANKTKS